MSATTAMKKTRARISAELTAKDWRGGKKKYQAARTDRTATSTAGHVPAKKLVRITAGKKVIKGKPAGSQASSP